MRKILDWGSLILLAASVIFIGWLGLKEIDSGVAEEAVSIPAYQEGNVKLVEFDTSSQSYQDLSPREKEEQLLDWLLYAVVTASDLPVIEIEQALYDLPPVRLDTLAHFSHADTGAGRSRVLGSKKAAVVALIPKADTNIQADHLAEIVDEQRKNIGEIPKQVYIFEYAFFPDGEAAEVIYVGMQSGQHFFEPGTGYIEQHVRTIEDLQGFLQATDDVVAARLDGRVLVVGGRKEKSHHMSGIGIEEVATIWQSSQTDPDRLGFSLDPQVDPQKLRVNFALRGVVPTLWRSGSEVPPWLDDDLTPFLRRPQLSDIDLLLQEYHKLFSEEFKGLAPDEDLEAEFRQVVMNSQFQKARYDGDFQGTEVGMVLFYTDLLMKLWGLDKLESTPRNIPEFPNKLTLNPSSVHAAEAQRLGETRLWLGPKESALQKDDFVNALYLARVATRLFAVPHDFIGNQDLRESEPNVFDRVFIDWWNRHYAEVAQYEPQYERLNQIMKWSVIIAWLQEQGQGSALGMLSEVKPEKNFWFPDWASSRRELTFRRWNKLEFLEKGYGGSSTEALEIQHSEVFPSFAHPFSHFSGGVSLGGKTKLQELPPLSRDLSMAARRGGMRALETERGVWKLNSEMGNSIETRALNPAVAKSVITPGDTVRLRGASGEFKALNFERTLVRGAEGVILRSRNGDAVVGELRVTRTSNGLKMGWKARDLDTAYAIAKKMSREANSESALLGHPDVAGFLKGKNGDYLIQLRGSKEWVHLSQPSNLSERVAEGFLGRASDGPTSPIIDFGLIKTPEVEARLSALKFIEIRSAGPASEGVSIVETARPPPQAREFWLQVGRQPVEAFSDGDRIFVNWQLLPSEIRTDFGRLSGAMRQGVAEERPLPLLDEFASHSYTQIANRIVKDPQSFRQALNESLDAQLRRNIDLWKHGRLKELQERIAVSESYLGDLPEFRLQKALGQLEGGKVEIAVRTLDLGGGRPLRRAGGFLNEIEARLADPRLTAQQRANLQALNDYARLSMRQESGSRLGVDLEQGQLHLRYETELLGKKSFPLAAKKSLPKAVIYIEDSPGLSMTDWSPSSTASRLKDWVQSGRVDIHTIQDVDLATFKPSMLVEKNSGTKYRLVNTNITAGLRTTSSSHCQKDNNVEGLEDPCLVLLVRQKAPGGNLL